MLKAEKFYINKYRNWSGDLRRSLEREFKLRCVLGSEGVEAGLALLGDTREQLLDLGNCSAGVEALRAGLGTVHDGVAAVHGEGVS